VVTGANKGIDYHILRTLLEEHDTTTNVEG
jgi:NAD(P)-dependent dehydrogenase (short-subunit alcohol dehydrogenase family)